MARTSLQFPKSVILTNNSKKQIGKTRRPLDESLVLKVSRQTLMTKHCMSYSLGLSRCFICRLWQHYVLI